MPLISRNYTSFIASRCVKEQRTKNENSVPETLHAKKTPVRGSWDTQGIKKGDRNCRSQF